MPEERLRFISSEPVIALALKQRKSTILPEPIYQWAVGWVEDVGRTLRSREAMVGAIAGQIYGLVFRAIISALTGGGL